MKEIRTYEYVDDVIYDKSAEILNRFNNLFMLLKSDNIDIFDLHGKELEDFICNNVKKMVDASVKNNYLLDDYFYNKKIKNFHSIKENGEIILKENNLKRVRISDLDSILVFYEIACTNVWSYLFDEYIKNYKENQACIRKTISRFLIKEDINLKILIDYLNKKYKINLKDLNYLIGEKSLGIGE